MPFHLDYRPKTFDEVIGNDHVKDSLMTILERKDKPHTYLFTGPSGTGKTTIGRIFKDMLGCSETDFAEFNSANTRGIDTIREVMQNCHYSPLDGKVKVYLFDEVHQWLAPVQNAILKFLEDTPPHVYVILCTTDPDRLISAVHTRCTAYMMKLLNNKQMRQVIQRVLDGEKVTDMPKSVIDEIIRVADGCPRQALVILDQVIDILDEDRALAAVTAIGGGGGAEMIDLCRGVFRGEDWKTFKDKLKYMEENTEPEKIRYAILGYLNSVVLASGDERASALIDIFSENTFYSGKAGITRMCHLACKK